ncbi:hypothetical protein SAMN05421858_3448 [Haladaptatus litoreus]|uniref:Uncharacterized protein n=1 Tax=Haladaptatus litoreus TaxID=553468 RepID=A0A1N7D9Z9_9EURY|nr:hypothetical protein SAMN05421858_3448 [Haladaptatus litoreus]
MVLAPKIQIIRCLDGVVSHSVNGEGGDAEHVFREERGTTMLGNQPNPGLLVSLHRHISSPYEGSPMVSIFSTPVSHIVITCLLGLLSESVSKL